jgi:type IV pilus assembly protein PilM
MAKKVNHVWGIEIGQSAIKALRCHTEGDRVIADSFDFVEYPKILSQPDSEPDVLLADALEQFTSRNNLRGCKVAVSVPGQQGLAKFFKPPPVEVKKIPDIVRYEAKQQIPFDLNDVIWDFQPMAGANIEEGYALDSEVALFAMKREAVYRTLKPFQKVDINPEIIQLSPVAIYNMVTYDRFSDRMMEMVFDPDKPPKSLLILSIGTDATDLIVTNGFRIWQRSMPIGGNHFTRQLSKELKLTFAKAEHLKRNAMQADDPKLIFQAMRPIFNDMHTEIQRSVGFFKQINKKAEIESILLLGNTAKLPGLQAYLAKSLSMDVQVMERFDRLNGMEVTGAPTFKDNQPSFGVVYGLCLQALNEAEMRTNLLPQEIVMDRLVASKKPWASVAAATLLVGMAVNYGLTYGAYSKVAPELWQNAETQVQSLKLLSDDNVKADETQMQKVKLLRAIGTELSANTERRKIWLELISVINASLNRDPDLLNKSPAEIPYNAREDFHLTEIDSQYLPDIAKYLTDAFKTKYNEETRSRLTLWLRDPKLVDAAVKEFNEKIKEPVTGPAWVVRVEGYHYHNGTQGDEKADFVRKHLVNFFETGKVQLPGPDGTPLEFSCKEMGISYPILYKIDPQVKEEKIGNPEFERLGGNTGKGPAAGPTGGYGGGGGAYGAAAPAAVVEEEIKDENGNVVPAFFVAPKITFTVQFVWQERPLTTRMQWKQSVKPLFDPMAIPPKSTATDGATAGTGAAVATPVTPNPADQMGGGD